jgi:hypothetical protein
MSDPKTMGPIEVREGFKNEGALSPPNIHSFTGTGGGGIVMIRGKKHQITSVVGNSGASMTMINKSEGDLGDGKKSPGGERRDRNVAAGNADADQQTITRIGNPDGSGIVIVSGGGDNPTLSIALGDQSCSFTMSAKGLDGKPLISFVAGEHELEIGWKGTKTTKTVIQEKLQNKKNVDDKLDEWAKSMQDALKPFTEKPGSGKWGCCGGKAGANQSPKGSSQGSINSDFSNTGLNPQSNI